MIRLMVKVYTNKKMDQNTMEAGKMTKKKDLELKFGLMDQNMKGNLKRGKLMEKELCGLKTEAIIKEIFKIILSKVLDAFLGVMGEFIKVNGNKIK